MMLIVTGVGFLIHVYSIGYMHGDPGFWRFFAYLNLFIFAMLNLILADNFLLMFLGWEGVGLCSYLLIGFWYDRKFEKGTTGDAAKKAFVVNRIGDFGFLIGMFLIVQTFGTLNFQGVFAQAAGDGRREPLSSFWITLALFLGATGKSAQIPLFVWLPDAMAGPTPVSALIHAATMVTAGVYMVARCSVLFALAPATMDVVAVVGSRNRPLRRHHRPRPERHQESARLLHDQPARIHVPRARSRGVRRGHLPCHDARLLQGAALPRLRLRHPRAAR